MINAQFNQLREFAQWVRVNVGKSCNIEMNIWRHTFSDEESVEYRVWIDGIINKSSKNLAELAGMIPKLKQLCELNMEVAA